MPSTAAKMVTADELLAMGDIGRCELIYGELVMMSPAGLEHGVVAMRFGRFLSAYVEDHHLGICPAAETGYKIESNPDLVRAADASFIRKERLTGPITRGYFEGVPDLAIEVVSPGDTKREVAEKVNMWLERNKNDASKSEIEKKSTEFTQEFTALLEPPAAVPEAKEAGREEL